MPSDADPSDLPYPSITPYLFYRDAAAALDWLVEAFGFTERRRITANDGTVAHAEVLVGAEGVVMFGSPGDEYESPDRHAKPAFSLYIRVDDCDRHARRAEGAGARIVVRPIDRPVGRP